MKRLLFPCVAVLTFIGFGCAENPRAVAGPVMSKLAAASSREDFLELIPSLRYGAAADSGDAHAIAMILKKLHSDIPESSWRTYAEVADMAARNGSGWCACELAQRYQAGIYGFPQDRAKAYEYWVLATKWKYPEDRDPVLRNYNAFTKAGEISGDPELVERFFQLGVQAGEIDSLRELSSRITSAGNDSAKLDARIEKLEEDYREADIALRKAENAANNEYGDAIRADRDRQDAQMQAFANTFSQIAQSAATASGAPGAVGHRGPITPEASAGQPIVTGIIPHPSSGNVPTFTRDVVPNPTDWPSQRQYYLAAAQALRNAASKEANPTLQADYIRQAAEEERKAAALVSK